jgi:hypothetical protein
MRMAGARQDEWSGVICTRGVVGAILGGIHEVERGRIQDRLGALGRDPPLHGGGVGDVELGMRTRHRAGPKLLRERSPELPEGSGDEQVPHRRTLS